MFYRFGLIDVPDEVKEKMKHPKQNTGKQWKIQLLCIELWGNIHPNQGQNVLLTVRKVGSIIEKLKEMLEEYLKKTEPEYYPPVENLLDLIYEHYTENNPVEKNTVAGKQQRPKKRSWKSGWEGWMEWIGS